MSTTYFPSPITKAAVSVLIAGLLAAGAPISAAEFTLSAPVPFGGAVDGSAGVDVGDGFLVGATDEDNVLRLFGTTDGDQAKDLKVDLEGAVKSALGLSKIKECDLEGAAKIGNMIFWISSHGRNKDANEKKERQVFFATRLTGEGKDATLEIEGEVYTKLIEDLANHPELKDFKLNEAAKLAPKEEGAINIESLVADGDKLMIAFRNPKVNGGDAMLVPLLNPGKTIQKGGRAQLGKPELLKLEGLGFCGMANWNGEFLIVAGDHKDRFESGAKPSRLFAWKPGGDPRALGLDLGDLNPEAVVVAGQGTAARVLILSDDGKYPKQPCNVFRGVWLKPAKP